MVLSLRLICSRRKSRSSSPTSSRRSSCACLSLATSSSRSSCATCRGVSPVAGGSVVPCRGLSCSVVVPCCGVGGVTDISIIGGTVSVATCRAMSGVEVGSCCAGIGSGVGEVSGATLVATGRDRSRPVATASAATAPRSARCDVRQTAASPNICRRLPSLFFGRRGAHRRNSAANFLMFAGARLEHSVLPPLRARGGRDVVVCRALSRQVATGRDKSILVVHALSVPGVARAADTIHSP